MAPGPLNLGDNRFASLSASPKAKKKRPFQKLQVDFPDLPETQCKNPRYLVVSSKNSPKTISDYNCFAVHRALKYISKDITSISNLRDGNLLLLVNSREISDKFIKVTSLPGLCDIECKLHNTLNFVKGTIYAPCLINIPENEIVEELKSQNVHSVFKFTKMIDGTPKPFGKVLVTFDRFTLPSKLTVSWHTVKVSEYIPNPMRCKSCQLLGHTSKHCKNPPACVSCNLAPHLPVPCTRIFCANCTGQHPASSPECPQYQTQKQLLHIKTSKKCSFYEARTILKQQQNTTNNPTLTYSTVANQSTASVMLVKKSRNPNTITNTDLPTSSTKVPAPLSPTYPTSRTNSLNLEENLTSSPSTSDKTDFSYLKKTCIERSRSLRAEANALLGQTYNDDNNTLMTSRSNSNESIASQTSNLQTKINTTDSDTMDDPDS
uniref:Gag protein n=1 Tax=Drosophila melanogaster TaxID=7227 RepID=Q9GP61_DROME|nr:gag [Drosophila melanogaster]